MKELALGFTLPTHSHSNDCGDLQTSFTQGGGRSTQIDTGIGFYFDSNSTHSSQKLDTAETLMLISKASFNVNTRVAAGYFA